MNEEDKITMLLMVCGVIVFAIIPVMQLMGLAGVDTFPLWGKSPMPQIVSSDIQGWIIVMLPMLALIYGLYVGYHLHKNGEQNERNTPKVCSEE